MNNKALFLIKWSKELYLGILMLAESLKSFVQLCIKFCWEFVSLKMEAPWTIILLMYATPLLLVEAGYFNGGPGLNELAISSEIAPTRACSVIGNIDTLLQCFTGCMKRFRRFYMFGRNSATLTCFCCKDPPQLPLPGTVFNTYIARQYTFLFAKWNIFCWMFLCFLNHNQMILLGVQNDIGILYTSTYLFFRFDHKNILSLNNTIYVINCYHNSHFAAVLWLHNFKHRKKCFQRHDLCNCDFSAPCPLSYSEYTYGYLNICLRFVSNLMTYPMASSVCQQDGGDLVRLDSQRKFDIFQEFVGES